MMNEEMPADVPENEEERCEVCGRLLAPGEVRFLQPNPYDDLIVPGFNWSVVQHFPAVCEGCFDGPSP